MMFAAQRVPAGKATSRASSPLPITTVFASAVTTWNVWAEDEGYRAILAITEYLERRVIMAGWGV